MDSFKNFAKSTIGTGGSADTVVQLTVAGDANARFPAVPFNATIWNGTDYADPADDPDREIVRVTAKNNTTGILTVNRGQEGTTAVTRGDGTKVYRIIAGVTQLTITQIAPLDNPVFTGSVNMNAAAIVGIPTKAVDTNTNDAASTAFVIGQASAVTPTAPGTGAVGTSKRYMRADAVIPTDTTRAPIAAPVFTGATTVGVGGTGSAIQQFNINGASGADGSVWMSLQRNGVAKGYVAIAGNANHVISGSVADDACIRAAQRLLLSADDGSTPHLSIDSSGNVAIGNAALATNATNGFFYAPSSAGAPTGTPTAKTGRIPMQFDSTNNKLYAYLNGAWKSVTLA